MLRLQSEVNRFSVLKASVAQSEVCNQVRGGTQGVIGN